jgi:hypothetical protein
MRRAVGQCVVLALGLLATSGPATACDVLLTRVQKAILEPEASAPIDELRAIGPEALDRLFQLRDRLELHAAGVPDRGDRDQAGRQIERLNEIIDQVGSQRYCSRSRLYWHTDLEKAREAAAVSGKPILSLRMLGNLNEEFSCANSRFFRTTLYANDEISRLLRENFVLHWKSVRPVPKVTIDFGDGRKLERTLTGNSIHYILTPQGDVVEALPGLYGPKAFLQKVSEGLSLAKRVAAMQPAERQQVLADHHAEQFSELAQAWQRDLASVGREPIDAALVEDENAWEAIAALHADDARLDAASRELIRSQNPTAAQAGRLAITKRVVEDPLVRMVRTLETSIAMDTVKNEYRLHRRIHEWLRDRSYHPNVDELNERVYAELFLTPSSDPWLGLAPSDVYTALPNGGVVRSGG